MTELLNEALAEIQKLPSAEQDAIAALILGEIADERAWSEKFANSELQLGRWASRVRDQIGPGLGR
jgi:hypothetical protein